ncbi:Pathogenesis-related protein [Actinidia chinensis var. chinensis]|uniref:Pathogenesis-related protein n=1 Tax=Actinidia chinensis var. chinensis TaxID=1590841 RepID=A0A2R6Q831_ACTCC|nr:Pathogenesis-related protein [Actinidia chinensis var. chinensis]
MASEWVKSLQCKSRALDDVVHHNHHRKNPKHHPLSSSCRRSVQSLKDVVDVTKHRPRKRPKQPPMPESGYDTTTQVRPRTITRHSRATDPLFPGLTELPAGHPSRNVVEIIFHTSWSPKSFSGRVEMVFKVQNLHRTVTRFEEYRETVKSQAVSMGGDCEDHARCVADGNEVMRFHCLAARDGTGYDGSGPWTFHGGKGVICTFSGSGGAHESAGGGRGRKAMLVCRVIAGRVFKQLGFNSLLEGRVGFNSVSGDSGELLVFDSRAVLPCFLIIYQL